MGEAERDTAWAPAQPGAPPSCLRILMVSDFFYPNTGGVESHIYQLSQCLLGRGHDVVVLTHCHGRPARTVYMTNGLKVVYAPRRAAVLAATLPTFLPLLRAVRRLLIHERITLVHSHQAFSPLAHEALLTAATLGVPAVFTDHSLFGFADVASILMNKALKFALCAPRAIICVSHTSKENTVLRACVPPRRVAVIPNGARCLCVRLCWGGVCVGVGGVGRGRRWRV